MATMGTMGVHCRMAAGLLWAANPGTLVAFQLHLLFGFLLRGIRHRSLAAARRMPDGSGRTVAAEILERRRFAKCVIDAHTRQLPVAMERLAASLYGLVRLLWATRTGYHFRRSTVGCKDSSVLVSRLPHLAAEGTWPPKASLRKNNEPDSPDPGMQVKWPGPLHSSIKVWFGN